MSSNFLKGLAPALLMGAALTAQDLPIVERTLPNGMRVLLVERHDQPTISCGWVARVGSSDESAGLTGLAHLFEHMMFKGTERIGTRDAVRDAALNRLQDQLHAQIRTEQDRLLERQRRGEIQDPYDPAARTRAHQDLLDKLDLLVAEQRSITVKDELARIYAEYGATGLNANTTTDRTYFYIDVPANRLELWAWLEADRIKNAVFREFYSERSVVLEERRQRTDATPAGRTLEAFEAMQWLALPYHWPVIGWISDINHVTREQAAAFFKTYYAPNNITAILVGDFKVEEACRVVETYFSSIPGNPEGTPPMTTTEPVQAAERRMVAEAEAEPMFLASYKTVPGVHRDAPALEVLASVLNGASGRLNTALVRGRKVAISTSAYNRGQKYAGTFQVSAWPAPGHSPEELEPLVYRELERIQQEGITEEELQKVKNQVQAGSCLRLESNGGLRDQLAEAEGMGTYRDFLQEPALLRAVTREEVRRVANQYFKKEQRNVLLLKRRASTNPQQEAK